MRFVIVGFGRVGSRTARVLQEEGYDVVIVDNDSEKVHSARERGFDVVEGDGADEKVLEEAGVSEADAVGGITGDWETNLEICRIAKEHGCRTVMRISEDVTDEAYDRYTEVADEIIYPERLGAAGAKTALLGGNFNALGDLTAGLQLTTVHIDEDAPVVGERISELDLPPAVRIYAHGHKRDPMTIPLPRTTIEAGDRLALLLERSAEAEVRAALLGE